jgi:hypothetical protein
MAGVTDYIVIRNVATQREVRRFPVHNSSQAKLDRVLGALDRKLNAEHFASVVYGCDVGPDDGSLARRQRTLTNSEG